VTSSGKVERVDQRQLSQNLHRLLRLEIGIEDITFAKITIFLKKYNYNYITVWLIRAYRKL
jgi:hypothetical protein